MAVKKTLASQDGPDAKKADQVKLMRKQAGRWLAARREDAGLTQAEVAEKVGLRYYTFISQVEGGHGRAPAEHFEAWAKALGVDSFEFTKTLISFYEPEVFRLLFKSDALAGQTA